MVEQATLVYEVEPMQLSDIAEVMAIERLSFSNPWPASAFRYELLQNDRAYYFAARPRAPQTIPPIVGYGGFWLAADEAHISTIAVHPDHRGRSLGELLLVTLIERARELGAGLMTLEVRVSNEVAQNLYQKFGFQEIGVRRGYYSDNHEDALLMTLVDLDSEAYGRQFSRLRSQLRERLQQKGK